jgi:uncharacterized protein
MPLSLFQASVPVFTQSLTALGGILAKAEAQAASLKFDAGVLLQSRLYPNMWPLTRQVQVAADFAKNAPARLAGREPPALPDTETSFAELGARIARTLEFLATFKPADIDGQELRAIEIKAGGQVRSLRGQDYLLHFALPNFFFHSSAAYAILRHNGIELAKKDFLGG